MTTPGSGLRPTEPIDITLYMPDPNDEPTD